MKFRANWYDHTEVKYTDEELIEADSITEATRIAYGRYNGRPPAPLLWLEEVKE